VTDYFFCYFVAISFPKELILGTNYTHTLLVPRGMVVQFLGVTSGWADVTITNFLPQLDCSISLGCSQSETVWD
jgi:hypothetical protein